MLPVWALRRGARDGPVKHPIRRQTKRGQLEEKTFEESERTTTSPSPRNKVSKSRQEHCWGAAKCSGSKKNPSITSQATTDFMALVQGEYMTKSRDGLRVALSRSLNPRTWLPLHNCSSTRLVKFLKNVTSCLNFTAIVHSSCGGQLAHSISLFGGADKNKDDWKPFQWLSSNHELGVVKGQALKLVNDNDLWAHDIGRNPFRFPLIFHSSTRSQADLQCKGLAQIAYSSPIAPNSSLISRRKYLHWVISDNSAKSYEAHMSQSQYSVVTKNGCYINGAIAIYCNFFRASHEIVVFH